MQYQYKVVPFIGRIKMGKGSAQEVAEQLQALIDQFVGEGWEYYRIDPVQIEVRPGCLASLFGAQASYINFDQVIFRRPVTA